MNQENPRENPNLLEKIAKGFLQYTFGTAVILTNKGCQEAKHAYYHLAGIRHAPNGDAALPGYVRLE